MKILTKLDVLVGFALYTVRNYHLQQPYWLPFQYDQYIFAKTLDTCIKVLPHLSREVLSEKIFGVWNLDAPELFTEIEKMHRRNINKFNEILTNDFNFEINDSFI